MFSNAWRRTLAHLKRKIHSSTPKPPKRRFPPLRLERLEDRLTPATVSFINPLGGSWDDPSNWSTSALPTANDDVVINLASGVTVHLSSGSASVNSLQVNDALVLDGGSLTVAGDLVNAGAIRLAYTDANNDPALIVNGTLTNTSTGLLSADQGTGGVRYVAANIDNQGSVNVDAGVGLQVEGSGSAGPTFTQEGGSFAAGSGGWLVQIGGTFRYTGGTISGEYTTLNAELDVADTVSADAVINVRGRHSVLDENASPSVTLVVQGTDWDGDAVLTTAAGAFNAGTIDLEPIGSAHNCDLVIGGPPFTNEATGLIDVRPGTGGDRHIIGKWVNDGTVDVAGGTSLNLWGTDASGPDFTQAGGAFIIEAGAWVVQGNGRLHYTGGSISGEYIVYDGEIDVWATVTATSVIEVRGQSNILDENASPTVTLWVQGSSYNGDGVLTAADGAVNAGVIDLESIQSSWNSSLDVAPGGTLTNIATGVIQVRPGSGGGRYIDGNLVNQGLIDVASGTSLTIQGTAAGGPNVTQADGVILAEAGAWIVQVGGFFHYTGGSLSGEYIVLNTELAIEDTVTAAALIEVRGQGNTLDRNLAPGVTLWVEGSNWNGDGVLTAVDGAVNDGTIDLESVGYWWWNSNLDVAPSGTFTNAGAIKVRPGSGGDRHIIGRWVNEGTMDVQGGTSLNLWGTDASGPDFTQAGGAFVIEGGAWVVQGNGRLHYTGGAISGEYIVYDGEIDVQDTVTAASVIELRGQSNTLDENASPTVTLWVQGSSYNGDGVLTAVGGAVNAGVIDLESIQNSWNSNLAVAAGGTLTNAPTGVIVANAGTGGGRNLYGDLLNQGTLSADVAMQWCGDVTNAGTVDVPAGVVVSAVGLNGVPSTLAQTGGTLTVDGSLLLPGGTLDVEAGALDGAGTFQVQNAQLSFGPGAGGPLPVQVVGQGDVLVTNQGPGVTVWVRGDDMFNQGVLAVAPGAVNAGTILLQSASTYWGSFLSIQDVLDNTDTGVIHVTRGAGGGRSLTGDLTNEGTLLVDADASLDIDGATAAGPTLTQNDGAIEADGSVVLHGGFLDFEGGAVMGAFTVDNSQIYVDPGVTDPSQIRVVGAGNLLLDNGSATTTLLVQGDDAFDGGVLTVAPDATNAGVIQLDSASGYWGSSLVLQDMLDNLPGGSILVTHGAGGGRSIVGDLDNEGLLSVAADEPVTISGATAAGPTFIQDGGLIQADGRLVLAGGLFDFESGDISGSFLVNNAQIYVGPDATDPATVDVVGSGDTLLGNEGPSVTLRVEGDDGFGQGVLTASAGAVNAGSIVLDSTSSYFGSALAAPDTLLNAQGGTISVAGDGGGSRSLLGDFINAGTIYVPSGEQLTLQADAGAAPTLIQSGGLIAAAGRFVEQGGLFDFESGATVGDFVADGAAIYVGPDVTAPSLVEVAGRGNVLLDNASTSTTLWVGGTDDYGQAVLTAAPGAGNSGTLLLASSSSYWGETVAAPDGLLNRPEGRLAIYGGGGPAAVTGTLTNDGYLMLSGPVALHIDDLVNDGVVGADSTGQSVAPGMQALALADAAGWAAGSANPAPAPAAAGWAAQVSVGSWLNQGVVAVDPGAELDVEPGAGGAFTQANGLVAAVGDFVVQDGLFHYTGGGLWGAVVLRDGQIRVDAGVTDATVYVVGHLNALLDNAGPVTLRVQGGSPLGDGDAVLTAADGSTNHGGVVLESLDGVHHGYFLVPQGSFTNEADGTIRVDLPPGDAGAGSILAGRLEDDGGIADTTGLPVTAALQPALQWSPSYCADDSGSSDGSGSSGDGSSETDAEANQARMAYTPGVDDGVIVVAELNTGPDATALSFNCTCGYIGPTSSGWYGDSSAVDGLIGSLYNLGQVLIDNTTAGAGLVNGAWNAFQEGVNIGWDAASGLAGGASVIGNQVFGTPTYNPLPQSSLMKGLEAAGAQGQLLPYMGQAAVNVLTLPLSAANAADAAFQSFKNTGDLTSLSQWAGTYGLALFTAAEGGAGLAEGGAGLLQEADAAALEAEMAGLPGGGWAGVLGAAGAPEGLLTFLADESGALKIDLSGDFSSEPGADLAQAEGQLGGAVGGATTEAAQLAAEGGDAAAAGLARATKEAALAQAAETEATGGTAADTTAAAEALEQQTVESQQQDPSAGGDGLQPNQLVSEANQLQKAGADDTAFRRSIVESVLGVSDPAGSDLFGTLGIDLDRELSLNKPSDATGLNKSYITYVFKDKQTGAVVYVGRASGAGTPEQVLQDRLNKPHLLFDPNTMTAEVVDVQSTKLASQGAEEVYMLGFEERGSLINEDPALSYLNLQRAARSLAKLRAFANELASP